MSADLLELDSAPAITSETPAQRVVRMVREYTARIMACVSYAMIVALHSELKTQPEAVRAPLRAVFTTRRDYLLALQDLPQVWFQTWQGLASAIYSEAQELGRMPYLPPCYPAKWDLTPTDLAAEPMPLYRGQGGSDVWPPADGVPEAVAPESTDRTTATQDAAYESIIMTPGGVEAVLADMVAQNHAYPEAAADLATIAAPALLEDWEIAGLMACRDQSEWDAVCDVIKGHRDGEYPADWGVKILASGVMATVAQRWAPAFDGATLADDLATIAEGASAPRPTIGARADGTMQSVGFSSAAGYVQALALGVKQATATEYRHILMARYGYTISQMQALTEVIIPEGEAGADVVAASHVPEIAPGTKPQWEIERDLARERKRAGTAVATEAKAPTRGEVATAIHAGQIVAGARSEASGVMVGWSGSGELTRSALRSVLMAAGVDLAYLPAPKSAHAHAGFALGLLSVGGHVVRADRGKRRVGASYVCTDGVARRFQARWTVGSVNHRGTEVGAAFGETVLTATLTTDGRLDMSGDQGMIDKVRGDYLRRCEEDIYPAAEITMWLRSCLMSHYRAIRMGGVWYVPAKHADAAERLCTELSKTWGLDWIVPALPVSTTDQLCQGLSRSVVSEAEDVLADLAKQTITAREANQAQIGARAALTLLDRLRTVNERAKDHAKLLGPDHIRPVRTALEAALAQVLPLCDDTAQRFSLIESY